MALVRIHNRLTTSPSLMTPECELADKLRVVADIIQCFQLTALQPALNACEKLIADDAPLDVAVLGQFKSGKSSLLNALLGEPVFPVGALPVTAVITRARSETSI
jgi:predicted GTPase